MRTLILGFLLISTFSSYAQTTHDFKDQNSLQLFDEVIAGKGDFEGQIVDFVDEKVKVFPRGVNFGYSEYFDSSEVFKRVACKGEVCENKKALDKEGYEINVYRVYDNGKLKGFRGQSAVTLKSTDVFAECECLGDICKGDKIISPNGENFHVRTLYQNGYFEYFAGPGFYIGTPRESLQSVVDFPVTCSLEQPCKCDSPNRAQTTDPKIVSSTERKEISQNQKSPKKKSNSTSRQ